MNPSNKKHLRKFFLHGLQEIDSGFVEEKLRSPYVHPGEVVYVNRSAEPLWMLIVLVADRHGRERFTVEIGWSKLGRFPNLSMRPSPDQPDGGAEYSFDEYMCRLGRISEGQDKWWNLPTSSSGGVVGGDAVSGVVQDALRHVQSAGIPYFEALKSVVN